MYVCIHCMYELKCSECLKYCRRVKFLSEGVFYCAYSKLVALLRVPEQEI